MYCDVDCPSNPVVDLPGKVARDGPPYPSRSKDVGYLLHSKHTCVGLDSTREEHHADDDNFHRKDHVGRVDVSKVAFGLARSIECFVCGNTV